jgi:hypothetical protein
MVPTPGEYAVLVATELRTSDPVLVQESRADGLPGAGIPQPRGVVPTPGEDAAHGLRSSKPVLNSEPNSGGEPHPEAGATNEWRL